MKSIRANLSLLIAAAALAGPLTLRAETAVDSRFYLSPDQAEAGKAFVLSALNPAFYCTLDYYGQTIHVTDNRIDLTFRDSVPDRKIGVLCIRRDFGPEFE